MIKLENINKSFGKYPAVSDVSLNIEDSQVFGLVGTNGAGKSTLLRMISGVLRQDSGRITLNGQPVYNRPDVKQQIFFIPDDPYFFPNGNAADMCSYYKTVYPYFNPFLFEKMLGDFSLDPKRPVRNYSRGMKKQLAVLCGICSGAQYLLCDETFDGLDPVMRQAVKSIFANYMSQRDLTPVIASHNLRELEDICDHVGLLHKGGLLLSRDLEDMKLGLQRIQFVFAEGTDPETALAGLDILDSSARGRLHMLTVRASREEVLSRFEKINTVFFEILPLTLEEIFISETEVAGYDIKNIILG
ncbi:MAG: ABC transporter ATP-binding protein [Lachnospiraceae bacterium]|nr:ABC transporter ATP-binding protein [Lachnospiraceae bacterium]